jgi:hypothetical protein
MADVHFALPCAGALQATPQREQLLASLARSVQWPAQLV